MTVTPDIRIAHDGQDWACDAATLILRISEEVIRSKGHFLIALSGGTTPKTLYQTLATPEWEERFNWSNTIFLFGDERCVSPEHPESNFGMAQTSLFRPLGIQPDHIFRIKGESPDVASAAQEYEETIRRLTHCVVPELPRIDLIVLGLGEDGHTASLFPGTAALQERRRIVTVSQAPKGIRSRITLTLGVLNQASVVLFLVTGSSKAPMVRTILEPQTAADRALPAAAVSPEAGQLIWMLDRSAAAQLTLCHRETQGKEGP
jgi:6-phosphogluconolactonase